MTESAARDRIIHTIMPAVRARVAALAAGERSPKSPEPAIPAHVREASHAGHVAQVVVFCDEHCGARFEGDVIGETRAERLAAARAYLAADLGWRITDEADLCSKCGAR